jgi:hypothetical protein
MANTNASAILTAARAKMATIPISRDGVTLWKKHKTNQPFDEAPISKTEGFEVIAKEYSSDPAFGRTGTELSQLVMVVRLGHSPAGNDGVRENNLWTDVEVLSDLLEMYAWPAGVEAVFYEGVSVSKTNPSWWLTELTFKVHYTNTINT